MVRIRFSPLTAIDSDVVIAHATQRSEVDDVVRHLTDCSNERVTRILQRQQFDFRTDRCCSLPYTSDDHDRELIVCASGSGASEELRLQRGIANGVAKAKGASVGVYGGQRDAAELAAMAQAAVLASYRFDRHKSRPEKDSEPNRPSEIVIYGQNSDHAAEHYATREAVASGVILARDLVCEPANVLNPTEFAHRAQELEAEGVEVEVIDHKRLEEMGAHALLAVAAGSSYPGSLVVMRWRGDTTSEATYGLVGKGVTFDAGGISIKPAGQMEDMKGDMGGAAAVVGTMLALARSKAKVNVIGCIGIVENVLSAHSMRPSDVVQSLSGKTIEIINTDAEGRLVLADVLTYIQRTEKVTTVVDLATLTGACVVALGHQRAGLFTNEETLARDLSRAGDATGDLVWPMPMDDPYDKLMDSKIADMRNAAKGRWAGAITAAKFLQRFIEPDTSWAHLDIAGTAFDHSPSAMDPGWASGFGVRLLYAWLTQRQ